MTKSSMALDETTIPSMTDELLPDLPPQLPLTQQQHLPHHTPRVLPLTLQQQQRPQQRLTHLRPIHTVMDNRVEFQVQGMIVP